MITLNEWLELVGYKIVDGYDYKWDCYGKNAAYGLCAGSNLGLYGTDIVFCKETHQVREVAITDNTKNRTYRLVDPMFADALQEEANRYGHANFCKDYYIDLETVEDFMEKANAIVQGIEYDERISIPLDMTDAELLMLMRAAHALDITFNQFVELAISEALKSH
jgi:hypothetical protein